MEHLPQPLDVMGAGYAPRSQQRMYSLRQLNSLGLGEIEIV
jgi:hypothetical protein